MFYFFNFLSATPSFASHLAALVDTGGEFEHLQHDYGSLYAFIYNILQSDMSVVYEEHDGDSSGDDRLELMLTIDSNVQASFERIYRVNRSDVFERVICLRENFREIASKEGLSSADIGITIVMMLFGLYMSRGQYEIMIGNLNVVKEIEQIELYIESNMANSLNLGFNLSTDHRYSISNHFLTPKQNQARSLKMSEFKRVLQIMRFCVNTMQFIQEISPFHLRIVESFYALTSMSKCKKFVRVCREMYQDRRKEVNFNYKFDKIIPVHDVEYAKLDMDWWFEVPRKAVWFVYFNGAWRLNQRYLSRSTRNLFEDLRHVKNLIVLGFIEDDVRLVVVRLESVALNGKWNEIIKLMSQYNLYCPLRSRDTFVTSTITKKNLLCYVKNDSVTIFKLSYVA